MVAAYLATDSTQADVLNQAADVLQVGCIATDEYLVIRSWNRWMEAATGRTATDVVGSRLADVFPEITGTAAERAFLRALTGEAVIFAHRFHEYLLPLRAPPGMGGFDHMQQSARIVPVLHEGRITGAVALIEDVTERIAREQDLDEARTRAESANRTKSDFLAAMSHELRTPLTAILGYADLLDSEIVGKLNDSQKDQLHRIVTGAWHLINIIEEILTFSRIEAQHYAIDMQRADAALIVRDVQALLENQAAQKGIGLSIMIEQEPLWMETDPLRLKQILLNIIGNAIKFTDAGSVEVNVTVKGSNMSFMVKDTGPGIPQQYRETIFEPFVQVDQSYTRRKGGTGLGLPLSRSLAELMGGTLQLTTSSEGSCFEILLPVKAEVTAPSH